MKEIVVITLTVVAAAVASDKANDVQENKNYQGRRYASGYQQGDHYAGYQNGGDLYQGYRPYYLGQYASGYGYGEKANIKRAIGSGYQQGDHYDGYQNGGDLYQGYRPYYVGQYASRYGYGGNANDDASEFQQDNYDVGYQNQGGLNQVYALYYLAQFLSLFDDKESYEGFYKNNGEQIYNYYDNNVDESELNSDNSEIEDNTI